jgi:hypothetical protein
MKWWPWRRDRDRLEDAQRELIEAKRHTPRINAMVSRVEKHGSDNQFAARFRAALGGDR